ncbi:nonsense-mediated mRNA decay factor SMG8-like isoform X2 [Branchiostoma floridae x Branchiostoma belcheri]
MTEMKWNEIWCLPFVGDLEELPFKDDKVCVVGMFGKSQVGYGTKSTTINTVLDREVFPLHWPDGAGLQSQEDTYIEAFYDKSKSVIYLHLVSVFDTSMLVSLCGKLDRDLPYADVHKFWRDQELRHARGLLFLFHVCHILVALHPTCTFDMTYGQLLRTVDSIRLKMLPVLQEVLRDAPVGAEWKSAGRSCTPRLLFVFQRSCLPTGSDAHAETGKSKGTKHSPKKRLQHRIEDQIYRIFRKSRLLTNQSKDCLFTVPPNQTFVYIQSRAGPVDAINTLLSNLHQTCALGREAEVHTSRSYSMSRRTNQSTTVNPPSILLPAKPNSADDSLLGFLWQHVELVLSGKGFDDSVGRNPQPSHFELPTCRKWLTVCNMLYELLTESGQNAKVESSLESMGSSLDVETKFSDSRCSKVLPLASSAYQNNLPSHYTSKVHNNQLGQALKVFKQHARGPAYDHYVLQLQEDCEKFWANGRQLCEERSLTGQHCVHPFHTLPKPGQPSDPEPTDSQVVPCMPHNSRARSLCACNCGRKQTQRDDPFDVKAANHDFFSLMEEKCCSSLEHILFPVFQRQPQGTPGEDTNPPEEEPPPTLQPEPEVKTDPEPSKRKDSVLSSATTTASGGLSLALSLEKTAQLVRQPSVTESLPGMLHSDCPPGVLPKYSSWELVCLGPAGQYYPSLGLEQPGFIHGSNLLLAWDIPIHTERPQQGDQAWPAPGESQTVRRSIPHGGKPRRGAKDSDSFVRVYIGYEYECARGHRFLCSGPDKVMKTSTSGAVKETALKLLSMDMPLYFPCPCPSRGAKPHLGQLMRVFLTTPDPPVQIHLHPRLQPGPPPCPTFYPQEEDIPLPPSRLWVLRLPFVYVGEAGVISPPRDSQPLLSCKVLKGLLKATIVEEEEVLAH